MIGLALAAAAALPTILGLQLGAPVPLPECERMQPIAGETTTPYKASQSRECIEPAEGVIYFPPETMPTLMAAPYSGIRLIDGKLAKIGAATLDYNHADFIVAQLTAKFGKPDEDSMSSEDINSISVPSRVVIWKRPGWRAEYHSVGDTVEYGYVEVKTDAELAAEAAADSAREAQKTPF
jgi:hypothetical protein